jgi:hypothetical protein
MEPLYLHQLLLAINCCVSQSLGTLRSLQCPLVCSLSLLHYLFTCSIFCLWTGWGSIMLVSLRVVCDIQSLLFSIHYVNLFCYKQVNDIVLYCDFQASRFPSHPWFRSISPMLNVYSFGIYSFDFLRPRYVPSSTCLSLEIFPTIAIEEIYRTVILFRVDCVPLIILTINPISNVRSI